MCGRYTFVDVREMYERFGVNNRLTDLKPSYNVAPGASMPVVTRQSPNKAELMKWGLVPFWAQDPRIGYKLINARAETVATKPSFRKPLVSQRCIVPASGFYEWEKTDEGKVPHYFTLKNESMMGFAGLYDTFKDAEDVEMKTFTIITTKANGIVGKIHHRMPVILEKAGEEVWLDRSVVDRQRLQSMLKAYGEAGMEDQVVSTKVNSAVNDSQDLIEPV